MFERIFVCVPCHFKSKSALCATTVKRLDAALDYYREFLAQRQPLARVTFIVTGNVPYETGSPSLAYLQKRYLMERGVSEGQIFIGEGVGIFSEAESVMSGIKRFNPAPRGILVFSSGWYFWPWRRIWEEMSRKFDLPLRCVSVKSTGGLRTKVIYAAYGLIFWAAGTFDKIFVPLFRQSILYLLGELLTTLQSGRKNGFKMNGCT